MLTGPKEKSSTHCYNGATSEALSKANGAGFGSTQERQTSSLSVIAVLISEPWDRVACYGEDGTINQNRYLLQARLFIHIRESQLNVTQRGWGCGSTEILGSFSQLPGTLLHSKSAVKVVLGMCMDSAYRYTAWGRGKFTVKLVPEDTCGQQLHADAPRCICTRLSFPIAEKNILTFTA